MKSNDEKYNLAQFPLLPEDLMESVTSQYLQSQSEVSLFIQLRHNELNIPFIDLYIFDAADPDNEIKRFVIGENFVLPRESEVLKNYVRKGNTYRLLNSFKEIRFIEAQIQDAFPSWNFPCHFWGGKEKNYVIEHICNMDQTGPKELFYKANLSCIAFHLQDLCFTYSPEKSSPTSCFGLPLKLLRILNNEELVMNLSSEESKCAALDIYTRYSSFIDKIPTPVQWKYLASLYDEEQHTGKCSFSRATYNQLFLLGNRKPILQLYNRFLVLQKELSSVARIKTPSLANLQGEVNKLEHIRIFLMHQDDLNRKIEEKRNLLAARYEYSTSDLKISIFCNLKELLYECIRQNTCLFEYVGRYCNDPTCLLLTMRSKNKKTLGIFEVRIGEEDGTDFVLQFRGPCNRLPAKQLWFFAERWAREQNITFEPDTLIFQDAVVSDDLLEYAREKRKEKLQTYQRLGFNNEGFFLDDFNLDDYEIIIHDKSE